MTLTPEDWQRRREAVLAKLAALNAMYPPARDDDGGQPDEEEDYRR